MSFREFDTVVMKADMPSHGLKSGDVGAVAQVSMVSGPANSNHGGAALCPAVPSPGAVVPSICARTSGRLCGWVRWM